MRVVKDSEERRKEILDKSQMLFLTKGYAKTTINDILSEVEIAKGTFYYYYKSKEEVLDAIVSRVVDEGITKARQIIDNKNLAVEEKLLHVLLAQKIEDEPELIKNIHNINNAEMHQKSLTQFILKLSPLIGEIIQEGIDKGIFNTPYPKETAEILLASGNVIFDGGMFNWTQEEMGKKVMAFINAMEVLSGAKSGTFSFIEQVFQ